jgi:N-methylhydantoinase A
VYERDRLPLESEFRGPAILEQLDATTIIEPDDYAHVDAFGNVLIKVA